MIMQSELICFELPYQFTEQQRPLKKNPFTTCYLNKSVDVLSPSYRIHKNIQIRKSLQETMTHQYRFIEFLEQTDLYDG